MAPADEIKVLFGNEWKQGGECLGGVQKED